MNTIRIIYDFPANFEGKIIFGKYSIIVNVDKNNEFELKDYYGFITEVNAFQTK